MLDASAKKWLWQHLKTVANSGAYGIMAQFDRRRLGKEERTRVRVFGRPEPFDHRTNTPEDPGTYCFPPLAALITGGARLLLACIERLITDAGGTYLFMDTDSVAIVASQHGGLVPCPNP